MKLIGYCNFVRQRSILVGLKGVSDKESPLVSVVIPSYNHARYIGRTLQSLLNQSYINWEAIVVDNHSSDNTDEVMVGFNDPRIQVLKIHNMGVIARSRNAGIRAAKGEWLAFLDSDDWWTSDKLQICIDHIDENVDFIYHKLEIVSNFSRVNKRKIIKSWQVKPPVLMDLLLKGNPIANSSAMVRKKLISEIGGINESKEMIAAEDFNAWLRIGMLTNQFLYIPRILGYYLIHDQSVSKKDNSEAYKASINEFIDILDSRQRKIVQCNTSYITGRYYYLKNDYKIAYKKLLESILGGSVSVVWRALILLMLISLKKAARNLSLGGRRLF